MEKQIQIFNHDELGRIRALEIDGAPWFVGKDVAAALGYGNTRDAISKHVDFDDKQIFLRSQITTLEIPNRGLTFINESGLTREMVKELIKEVRINSATEIEIVWKFQECYTELEQGFMPELSV